MSKSILGIVLALVAIGAIGGLVYMNSQDNKPSNSNNQAAHEIGTVSHSGEEAAKNKAQQPASDTKPQETSQVEIKNFEFTQKKITVKKGTTVTWTNQDTAKHDITPDEESPDFAASDLFGKGESYSFTFNKVGIYSYYCSPHPFMKASVEVVE